MALKRVYLLSGSLRSSQICLVGDIFRDTFSPALAPRPPPQPLSSELRSEAPPRRQHRCRRPRNRFDDFAIVDPRQIERRGSEVRLLECLGVEFA